MKIRSIRAYLKNLALSKPYSIAGYTFSEVENLLAVCGFEVIARTSDGLYYHGAKIIHEYLLPLTFQESIIVMAEKKNK